MALTQAAQTRYTKPVLVAISKPFDDEDGLQALRSHPLFSELSGKDLQPLASLPPGLLRHRPDPR